MTPTSSTTSGRRAVLPRRFLRDNPAGLTVLHVDSRLILTFHRISTDGETKKCHGFLFALKLKRWSCRPAGGVAEALQCRLGDEDVVAGDPRRCFHPCRCVDRVPDDGEL